MLPRALIFGMLAVVLIVAGCPPGMIDPPTAADSLLARRWLRTDCVRDEGDSITRQLRDTRGRLESHFRLAFLGGPVGLDWAEIHTAGLQMYTLITQAADTMDTVHYPGLPAITGTGPAAFVNRYAADFSVGFRSRALAALGVIATPTARSLIDSVAAGPASLFKRQAQIIRDEIALTQTHYTIK